MNKNEFLSVYAQAIKKTLPGALVRFESNFDDENRGWDICPEPCANIRFAVGMGVGFHHFLSCAVDRHGQKRMAAAMIVTMMIALFLFTVVIGKML